MDIFEVIRDRRSIRKYKDSPVEPEKIEQILDAARLAPSWKNMQCWRFLVLRDPARRAALLEAIPDDNPGKKAVAAAPVIILLCADPRESDVENGIPYYVADAAIAFEHLCLAAHALGLGTCWMGWYDEAKIKAALAIPEPMRVVGFTPLGIPDQEPKPRPRKALTDIAYFDTWPANE
ncbi:nitroreductase family protein [Desulfuromonas sp. AOP6]|uniref:nitroreductase family protein n=1 Tax=Desulfuromonas sp. AOP6 TaxID=1566351 RepID=UPI00126E52DF|nr:nitroreductase family protein [Desulfuromonas sp. AOP6]BCA79962.1 nitroreductase [Desulfuromonas sp. AOP6]